MVKRIVQQRGLIMTGTSQLEMKLHQQSNKISELSNKLDQLEKENKALELIVKTLSEKVNND